MYRYEVFKIRSTIITSPRPYGILCKENQKGIWVTVAVVAPFSGSLETVSRLAEKCTASQLCPEQLLDVAVDFVTRADMSL